jgi:uncharacterized membrane protein
LTGLVVLAPTVITAWLVWKIFITVDNLLEPLRAKYPPLDFPGIGFAVVLLLILVVGALASNLIGRRVLSAGEAFFNRLPLVRRIYGATKELSEVFFADSKAIFRRVVLVPFPHRDMFAIAFVTNENLRYFDETLGGEYVVVFVPTTPNPTTGFFLLVKKSDSRDANITVEEAIKMTISGGAFAPRQPAGPQLHRT